MPAVPFGIKSANRSGFPEAVLKNMVLEADTSGMSPDKIVRVQRPGTIALEDYGTPIRGMMHYTAAGKRLTVAGANLWSHNTPFTGIGGIGITPMTNTSFTAAILGGGTVSLFDDVALTPLAMPDGRAVQDIDQLNSYVLLLCPDGRFYWMAPGATTVDPLDFATAESLPDGGVAIRRVGDEFIVFGADGGEYWQPTGDADAPFQRVSGRPIERGCLGRDTVRRFDNTVAFVGDDANVYKLTPIATVISDPALSERIRNRTGEMSAWVFGADGHKYYVLRIPGQGTWAFDASTSSWSQWESPTRDDWLPYVGYQQGETCVGGSYLTGKVWSITPAARNDDGVAFSRVMTGTVPVLGKPGRNDSFSVGVNASADCTAKLRWKDGQGDYPDYYDELEARAPYDIATMYRLGMPDQPYRTFELTIDADVRVAIVGAMANDAWR